MRNLNLYDARVVGGNDVGILAGINEGTIGNSSVVGTVSAVMSFGGLAGNNGITGVVFNSNAVGTVAADGHIAGGLIGRTRGQIINSYAQVAVSATGRNVGGLIGQCGSCTISNSFALGSVAGLGSRADRIGGFTGNLVGVFNLSNNYAHGDVSGGANRTYGNGGFAGRLIANLDPSSIDRLQLSANYSVGATDEGFVGRNFVVDGGNIPSTAPNYWNDDTDGSDDTMLAALNASKLSTKRLQMPTSNSGIYRDWSSDDWDFGTSSEYPILKYSQNPDDNGEHICYTAPHSESRNADPLSEASPLEGRNLSSSMPSLSFKCGTLIAPQIRFGLKDLQLVSGELTPPFAEGSAAYFGESDANLIRLIPTAQNSSATINVYLGHSPVQGEPDQRIVSGMTTMPIRLATGGITPIVLEIVSQLADNTTATVYHPLYIRYGMIIEDGSIVTEINSIEALQAINDNATALASRYRLTRNLNFNDPDSYLAGTINRNWIVSDFANTTDTGWTAIGNSTTPFSGEFDGNGYTISVLQINRDDSDDQGLFGVIAEGGIVRNLGLTELKIEARDWVGGLVGVNQGAIIDGFVIGEISAKTHVGGLVGGHLEAGLIANSYAAAVVEGTNNVGGLAGSIGIVGGGNPKIVNSYATGNVSAQHTVGGFAGLHVNGQISNSYATADVIVVASDDGQNNNGAVGGFVGQKSAAAEISNSYAAGNLLGNSADATGGFVGRLFGSDTLRHSYSIGRVASSGSGNVGGFAGQGPGTALSSYWNSQTSTLDTSAAGSGQTTAELQEPTEANGIYADWSAENWDFGTDTQYPILKYTQSTITNITGALRACDGDGLPNCGDTISPQIHNGLKNLRLADANILFPPFTAKHRDLTGNYSGSVAANPIRLIPTAMQDNTTINIYIGTIAATTPSQSVVSGEPSAPITLREGIITPIILEIVGTQMFHYPLYIRYLNGNQGSAFVDRNNNGFNEIYYLEDLHAIATDSTTLAGRYELARNLDFNNPNSYLSGQINEEWTVANFGNPNDTGWPPIRSFSGEFDGNGYAIYNLQINRANEDSVGLFGFISSRDAVNIHNAVHNLGLVDVRIEGNEHVGAIAGWLVGGISNSYATGSLSGNINVGGLVGNIGFYSNVLSAARPESFTTGVIINSHSAVEVTVAEYNGGGILGRCNGCTVLNSFAVGTVRNTNPSNPASSNLGTGGLIGQVGESLAGDFSASQVINVSNNYVQGDLFNINPVSVGTFLGSGVFGEAILNANYSIKSLINANDNTIQNPIFVSDGSPSLGLFASAVPNYFRNDIADSSYLSNFNENAFNRTGQAMQEATEPSSTATGVYYLWSKANWDFGDETQYPTLKHTSATNVFGIPVCQDADDATRSVGHLNPPFNRPLRAVRHASPKIPICGSLIAPRLRHGLRALTTRDIQLHPPFDAEAEYIDGTYFGTIRNDAPELAFIATALNSSATYSVYAYIDDALVFENTGIASGSDSGVIPLDADGITEIVIEVETQVQDESRDRVMVHYTLYVGYAPAASVDADQDGLVDINYLEQLAMLTFNTPQDNAIGYKAAPDAIPNAFGCPGGICRGYELLRNLDFNNPDSYLAGGLNPDWSGIDFNTTTNTGWLPIGSEAAPFVGEFEGNGFAIANLQIKRDGQDFQGLFGYIGNGGLSGNGGAVRNLGVVGVRIEAGNHVGTIAGDLRGSIANSYANGSVSGNINVGGLVGNIGFYTPTNADTRPEPANAGIIVNSRSGVEVTVAEYNGGGILGRCNGCTVLNSFAVGTVRNNNSSAPAAVTFGTGGFIGQMGETEGGGRGILASQGNNVSNNYAQGNLLRRDGAGIGQFIGSGVLGGTVLNANYAVGSNININNDQVGVPIFISVSAPGTRVVARDVPNYTRDDIRLEDFNDETLVNAFKRTGQVMQAATAPATTAMGVYYLWSEDNWDFGNAMQYPILKYTSATDVLGVPACRNAGDMMMPGTMPSVPTCGTLIAPKTRYGLSSLVAQGDVGDVGLVPPFDATAQNIGDVYFGEVQSAIPELVLVATTIEATATYSVYIDGILTAENTNIASSSPSGVITLSSDVVEVIVEVHGTETVRYPLYLRLEDRQLADRNNNVFIEIYYLEHLDAIRNDLDGNFELMRDLNFDDPGSYLSGQINEDWRADVFSAAVEGGWMPIGNETTPFAGTLDGNGYAIYNLRIFRRLNNQGLFGYIGSGGVVRNLGVANVIVLGSVNVGALTGDLRGSIVNSYATGIVRGNQNVGGLVGNIGSYTLVEADTEPDPANTGIIVNSRSSAAVDVGTSNGGGILGRCNGCTVLNSFAVGQVRNNNVNTPSATKFGTGGFIGQVGETRARDLRIIQAINISNNYAQGNMLFRSSSLNFGNFLGSGIFGEVNT